MAKQIKAKLIGVEKLLKKTNKLIPAFTKEVAKLHKEAIVDNLKPSKKSGELSKSFEIKLKGKLKYIIESDLPYADIQDKGGKIKITEKMRKKMWALYASTHLAVYKAIAITKKTFIKIKAKHYTDVKIKKIMNIAIHKVKKNIFK